ncbi:MULTISPECIES: hypothetical protein [Bradyrhizobium]|uniref:Uncharacterized protein n=1 Tax=Bradyrhizobium elkanii TaxID=29448 RepID=A0A4U6SG73_BRAEL|nr:MULTISPECIES: hypothetical protein [Bradyrhizobium]MTV14401.1 hypothetical protein [Bradyrhizobium sp. BR2003]TKV83906.1 hypothetical protein FDV58_01540 [Bradyrhizobium elkanii]
MFDVGDLVVCIDNGPKKGAIGPVVPIHHLLHKERIYRVNFIGTTWTGRLTVGLAGIALHPPMIGFEPYRFRKLDPAEPEFIEMIRSLRTRELEDAN